MRFRFFVCAVLCVLTLPTLAQEKILLFDSAITVNKDGSINVTEAIKVVAEGKKIRRGIYRDFPTDYRDKYGNHYKVDFAIGTATLNGKPTRVYAQDHQNGKRIELGEDYLLEHGVYTYTVSYTTKKQLGFFEEHDELYWNVTGLGWAFPIEKARARVTLPAGIQKSAIEVEGYTGYYGENEQAYTASVTTAGTAHFETIQPLGPQQGLTIVASWPKGFVDEPTEQEKWWWFFSDNFFIAWLASCFALVVAWYAWCKRRFERALPDVTVIPLFHPPDDMTPAGAYYIANKQYDKKAFAAEIVHMAVLGLLTIEYKKGMLWSGSYELKKRDDAEKEVQEKYKKRIRFLFGTLNSISLAKYNKKITELNQHVERVMEIQYGNYIDHHSSAIVIGGLLSVASFIPLIWLPVTALWVVLFGCAFFFLLLFAGSYMRMYTAEGKKVWAQVKGFELFLKTTEQDRLHMVGTPPTKTPELYEIYLPYAIALGVEKQWSDQFVPVFKQMEQAGIPYAPMWYGGRSFANFHPTSFASNISSSMTSAISASSSPPGSSSGRGGGGFSGGGGGGGGGGGR